MDVKTGLWIDHRKAVVVVISDKGEEIKQILSNVEKQHGRIDGIRSVTSYESQKVQADDSQEREFTNHLKGYYKEVLSCLGDAKSVLIFGPGEAKVELKKLMEQNSHRDRGVVMESADKMTDRQISAKVQDYFAS